MPDMLLVCRRGVKDGPFLLSLYQGRFYVRFKSRCESVSQLCVGIFMENFYTTCIQIVKMQVIIGKLLHE